MPQQLGLFNEAEAVAYAQNHKSYSSAFLGHGEVDISNNLRYTHDMFSSASGALPIL